MNVRLVSRVNIYLILLAVVIFALCIGFWPGVKGLNVFRGIRTFWLFTFAGFVLALEVGRINPPLGGLVGWGFFVALFDVMGGRQAYPVVSGDVIWSIALALTFILGFRANGWRWLAGLLAVVVFINLDLASWQGHGFTIRLFDPRYWKVVPLPIKGGKPLLVGVMENQPNLAHLVAISVPMMAGLFPPLAIVGQSLVALKSSFASLAGAVGLAIWKPKIMLPIVLVGLAAALVVDKPNFQPKADMERLYVWNESVTMARESPWMGRGIGTFKREFYQTSFLKNITPGEIWLHPQNELVRLFYEIGVLGPALAALAALWTLFRAWKYKVSVALLGSFVALLISLSGYEIAMMPPLAGVGALIWGATEREIWRKFT